MALSMKLIFIFWYRVRATTFSQKVEKGLQNSSFLLLKEMLENWPYLDQWYDFKACFNSTVKIQSSWTVSVFKCLRIRTSAHSCTEMYFLAFVCVHCCSVNVIFVFCIFLYGGSYLLSCWSEFLAIRLHFFIGVSAIHALVRRNKSCVFLFPLSLCIVWLQ